MEKSVQAVQAEIQAKNRPQADVVKLWHLLKPQFTARNAVHIVEACGVEVEKKLTNRWNVI